jgi:hypothetical protein
MKVITWAPGTDLKMDQLFDQLREQQYNDRSHRLWKNYSKDSFDFAVALTIYFNDNNEPEMCSSIASRDCWPVNAYRILNRLWKHSNKIKFPRVMSPSFAESAKSQIEWLEHNTNCELYFISRQTDNWEEWVIKNFQEVYGVGFKTDNYKYLTCPNECDDTCWQKIIYNGNEQLLAQWKQKTL